MYIYIYIFFWVLILVGDVVFWLLQVSAFRKIIPRQIKAEKAVSVIRSSVEELIAKCKEIVEAEGERIDEEEYINETDPSILRFLLASREEVGIY